MIRPFTWENIAFENDDPGLPTILVMRDSYAGAGTPERTYLTGYIPQQFGTSILIHYLNIPHFEEYVDLFEPDIVVFEAVDRGLPLLPDMIRPGN